MSVVVGYEATLTSWAAPNSFVTALHFLRDVTIEESAASLDVSKFRASGATGPRPGVYECLNGVRGWGGSLRGQSQTPASNVGHVGLVESLSGNSFYVTNPFSWSLAMEAIPLDVTAFQPASDWMSFRQGQMRWGGSYSCWLDHSFVPSSPTLYGSVLTPTFTLSSGNTITGSAFINSIQTVASQDDRQLVTFGFMGTSDITVAGTGNVITASGTTPVHPAAYGASEMVFTSATGQLYTGDAFWTRVGVSVTVGQKTEFEVVFQGTDDLAKT